LAVSAANCLSASLLYCINRDDVPPGSVTTEATVTIVRNEKKRLRVGRIDVSLQMSEALSGARKVSRCMNLFEDFCVVTDSIRNGIPIGVEVKDHEGQVVHKNDD
jgi:organic hydroperoxide reductase OsmC/OhrA